MFKIPKDPNIVEPMKNNEINIFRKNKTERI